MHYKNKKAFSFVEILIVIGIVAILAIIAISANQNYKEKIDNTKVLSDMGTLNNALKAYSEEHKTLPTPNGNTNFFKNDTSYGHYGDSDNFGVYGSITDKTLPKAYIDTLPLDPRNSSFYSYGKTLTGTIEFEIASVIKENEGFISQISGNYRAEKGPYNLIRAYNSPNFVSQNSKLYYPYNPEELALIATDQDANIYRQGDTITTGTAETKEIFFSDGSVSILEENSSLTLTKLDFPNKNNQSTFIKLALGAGTLWTKATHLNDNSQFQVTTQDTTASVRGTIFGVKSTGSITVIKGEVEVQENGTTDNITDGHSHNTPIPIPANLNSKFSHNTNIKTPETIQDDFIIHDKFDETVANIENDVMKIDTVKLTETETETETEITKVGCSEINYHDYQISAIEHGNSNNFQKEVSENNGTFKYTITASCDDGTLSYGTESSASLVSCNSGYEENGNLCTEIVVDTTCDIGDLTGGTMVMRGMPPMPKCEINITGNYDYDVTSSPIPEFTIGNSNYEVLVNGSAVNLIAGKNYENYIKVKWNGTYHMVNLYNTSDKIYQSSSFSHLPSIKIREK